MYGTRATKNVVARCGTHTAVQRAASDWPRRAALQAARLPLRPGQVPDLPREGVQPAPDLEAARRGPGAPQPQGTPIISELKPFLVTKLSPRPSCKLVFFWN